MSRLIATLLAAALFISGALGKTVTGVFKSEVARQQNGQYITKFMFEGKANPRVRMGCANV